MLNVDLKSKYCINNAAAEQHSSGVIKLYMYLEK